MSILAKLQSASSKQQPIVLNDFIREQLVDFLELDSLDEVARDEEFVNLGADSMQAVDFKEILSESLQCELRTTLLFDYPSVDTLVEYLLEEPLLTHFSVDQPAQNIKSVVEAESEDLSTEIAIIAIAGIFPEVNNTDSLWDKVDSGQLSQFTTCDKKSGFAFGQINETNLSGDELSLIGISKDSYKTMNRQQQLVFKVIAQALHDYNLDAKALSSKKTGVFIGVPSLANDDENLVYPPQSSGKVNYHIPLANSVSFLMNLKGPSEIINTFCTSVYVALHRAIQSINSGECEQAIVGGVNTISAAAFAKAVETGMYDQLLSENNCTQSFCDDAAGYSRAEGVGVIIIKRLDIAQKAGNSILALVKGTAVYHGGRGFSVESPNSVGMKHAIKTSLEQANISTDSVDYIEAHGIGNVLADAVEMGAINNIYRKMSAVADKKWSISSIKPTLGHPEIAAGAAALIKVLKAFEHNTIPGLASLGVLNSELGNSHSLILQKENQPWSKKDVPRRAALNGFAVGGLNAHVILEEYNADYKPPQTMAVKTTTTLEPSIKINSQNYGLSTKNETLLATIFNEVFELDFNTTDHETSLVDYGFDSIKVIHFVTRVNDGLAINIKTGQVLGLDNIADFVELIAEEIIHRPVQPLVTQPTINANTTSSHLSEVQLGLWYIQKSSPESTGFNVPMTFKIKGDIDSECLKQALLHMLHEHPVLCVRFLQDLQSAKVVQQITPVQACHITEHWQFNDEQSLNPKLFEILRTPFDLDNELLIRLYTAENTVTKTHTVFFVIHHIVFDGISGALFIRSFWEKYAALLAGKSIKEQAPDLAFFEYIQWEQAYLASEEANQDLDWWKAELTDILPTINLPYDKLINTPLQQQIGVGCESFTLAPALFSQLQKLSRRLKVNLSVLLLAIFNVFLQKLSQENDIVVSSPVLGRPKQAFEKGVGCYINLLVTRNRLSTDESFEMLVNNTKQNFINGIDRAYYPFSKLMPELGLTLTNPKEVPFPVSFTYQNIFDEMLDNSEALKEVETLFEVYQETEDHYTLEIYDLRDSLKLNLKYKRNLFEPQTIQRHAGYLVQLIEDIVSQPACPIKDYTLLPEIEKQQLLQQFQGKISDYPEGQGIHELFLDQVQQSPNAIALIHDQQQLTYSELAQQAQLLATYLQQQGVQTNDKVAICMERSIDSIVAIFATLMAGGAYLPIDVNNVADRIAYMLEDAEVKLLLTQTSLQNKLSNLGAAKYQTLAIDADWQTNLNKDIKLDTTFQVDQLAYVIYTSGSTGKPKGVMVAHQALVNLSYAVIDIYGLTKKDRVLQFASLSFDMSVEDIFSYLIIGASLVIRNEEDIQAQNFYQQVMTHKVTTLNIPPLFYSVIDTLSSTEKQNLFQQLRVISLGGESLPENILNSIRAYDVQILNAYGPTECTVNAAIADLSDNQPLTIGKPLNNTQFYVLDADLNLSPIGVNGELCIAGAGLAQGYLNRAELTAEKFIDNPFAAGKLYKTGDIVKWTTEGTIDYVGRLDEQVKIRGFRVELGEIETCLSTHEQIDTAVIIAQAHQQGNRLIAYYVALNNSEVDEAELRRYLRKDLPDYMIPMAFIALDEMPVTSNGKVNRALLESKPVDLVQTGTYVAATTEFELGLVSIWQQILEVEKIGIDDDFFSLGGHSLLAVKIILLINKEFSVDVALGSLFEAENIRNLAIVVADSESISTEDTLGFFEEKSNEFII